MYIIYTDGAYSSSRNQGGIAFIIFNENMEEIISYSNTYKDTTNNQMEMMACMVALESIKVPSKIKIYTDSMYVIGQATLNWKRNKNKELWQRFETALDFHEKVEFQHTRGHSEDEINNRCDKLAVAASQLIID